MYKSWIVGIETFQCSLYIPNISFPFCYNERFIISKKIFIKNINSCFGNKDFTDYIKDDNILMIVGLQTNFCIDATVKSAFERGYKVIVPQGANSTFDNEYMTGEETYKYYNDMMWPKRFATCVSVDEAIKLMESKS